MRLGLALLLALAACTFDASGMPPEPAGEPDAEVAVDDPPDAAADDPDVDGDDDRDGAGFGEECEDDDDCASGVCRESRGRDRCSQYCARDTDCPAEARRCHDGLCEP